MQTISFRNLAVNTLFLSAGRWIAQILNIIFVPVVLIYISPGEYGIYSIFQVVALIGGVILSFGLSTVFISRFGDAQEDPTNLLGRIIGQQVIIGGMLMILLLALSWFITHWLASEQPVLLIQLFFIGEYFGNIVLIINRWQILTNRHWQLSLGAVSKSVGQFIFLMIFVILIRYGLLGLVMADLGSKIISFLLVFYLSRNSWKLEFRKADTATALKIGLPAAPDPIFFWLLLFIPLYLLKQQGFLILAGAFSLGWRLLSPIELLGNSLASAAAGKILDKNSNRLGLNQWYRLSVFAVVFTALGILFFSKELLTLLFKPEYQQILPLLPVMGIGIMFLAFYYFEWVSISGSGKTYGLSLASGGGLLVILLGTFLVQDRITGLTATILFSSGLFTMWLIARGLNPKQKLGYAPYMVLCVSVIVIISSVSALFPIAWWTVIGKGFFLCGLVLSGGIVELIIRFNERKLISNSSFSFLEIPNYAEIAKKVKQPTAILDIGCSEGFFLGEINTSGLKVGIETDFSRLKIGHSERRNVNFVCADAYNLPFRKNCFETVVMIGVLPYLITPTRSLDEAHRILTSGGNLEISAASTHWFHRYLNLYNWKIKVHYYESSELEKIFLDSGFNLNLIYSRGRFIAPLIGNFFIISNMIDRLSGHTQSVLGPCASWARAITNPLIQWEYDHHHGDGYQIFVSGIRND